MRRRDVRAYVLNAVALGLRRASVLLGRLAHTVERPAGGVQAGDAKSDRQRDTVSSLPAEETVERSGQPPAHWLERVRSGGPPEHWLHALRQAHVETMETRRAAEMAETMPSAPSTQPVLGEARDDHARAPDEFQVTPAARSVTPQSHSNDRAAPAVSRAERRESPAVPESIEASPAQPAAHEQPPTAIFASSAAPLAKIPAPTRRRSDRVENPERVKRFRLQPLSAAKGESMPAPAEAVEETGTQPPASEPVSIHARPEAAFTPVETRLTRPTLIEKEAASQAQRERLEQLITFKLPAKRSTRGRLPSAGPPAPIGVSAPTVTATQAAKVAERWTPLEVITFTAEPAKDNWAELPDEQSLALDETPLDDDWDVRVRTWQHLQQLDFEQRGIWWNASPF